MAKRRVTDEMAKYVTRGELKEELDARDQRLIETLGKMVVEIDRNTARRLDDMRVELRVELGRELRVELGRELAVQITASEQRLRTDLGGEITRQILASEERLRGEIRALDDQYRDLPERVTRLEKKVGIKR